MQVGERQPGQWGLWTGQANSNEAQQECDAGEQKQQAERRANERQREHRLACCDNRQRHNCGNRANDPDAAFAVDAAVAFNDRAEQASRWHRAGTRKRGQGKGERNEQAVNGADRQGERMQVETRRNGQDVACDPTNRHRHDAADAEANQYRDRCNRKDL